MKLIFSTLLLSILFFLGCSKQDKPLTIATNTWIGYTPLFMAQESGELAKLNIKLLPSVSLAESADVFNLGQADLITSTQYEYHLLKKQVDLEPIFLIDRSNGGDMILSNKSIETLQHTDKILVYLEIDSINSELLEQFINKYHLQNKHFLHNNMDQSSIQSIDNNPSQAIIIVTYAPYNVELQKKGFLQITSTKQIEDLIVIDALFIKTHLIPSNTQRLQKLKQIIDKNIRFIQQHPTETYTIVKPYLNNISYEEFIESLKLIKWINKPDTHTLDVIEKLGCNTQRLIK